MKTLRIELKLSEDVIRARQAGAALAVTLGFSGVDKTRIATAISEITRNVIQHAGTVGVCELVEVYDGKYHGLRIIVSDTGRGIPDIALAMQDGFSTSVSSLGAGLPGAKRLMDEFYLQSEPARGTTVTMTKWCRRLP